MEGGHRERAEACLISQLARYFGEVEDVDGGWCATENDVLPNGSLSFTNMYENIEEGEGVDGVTELSYETK
jgi:hypothetical protein